MNREEQIRILSIKLEDVAEIKFTQESNIKLISLNSASKSLSQLLDHHYLSELKRIQTNILTANGVVDLETKITDKILLSSEGVLKVKPTDGEYSTLIDMEDVEELENSYCAPSLKSPNHFIFQNKIYMLPKTITNVDVYFIKEPDDRKKTETSELSVSLHDLEITIAEASCWQMDKATERHATALKSVYDQINSLNAKYKVEE